MTTKSQSIEEIVEVLSNLTVLDMSKLKEALEDKWGVKAAAPTAVMAGPAGGAEGAGAEKEEESTEFKVTLDEAPVDKKIPIIKVVRVITGLGLKEAKELVEGAPKVLKETAPKAEAEDIVKKITTAGGKASAKGL